MDKRATRQVTLYSILFLVMLLFSGITFFLGIQEGVKKTEEKYAHLLIDKSVIENYTYQQQDLITFYLTTYVEFEKFQNDWFASVNDITSNQISNPANVFDELASKANKQAANASNNSMQGYGLLGTSQESYIRSLHYFEKAANTLKNSTDEKTAAETLSIINNDDNYKIAIEQALQAQQQYYSAMHQWTTSIDPNIATTFDSTISQPISTWDKYPLIIKANIVASYLNEKQLYKNALPHDVVSRIDEFIDNGQAAQLNLENVNEILDLLIVTDAIRKNDFHQYSGTRYDNDFLPKIPFFNAN